MNAVSKLALVIALVIAGGCAAPKPATRVEGIVIHGTPEFRLQVENALALLKTNSPSGYATATNYIGIIEQGKPSGMWAWLKVPKFQLNDRTAFYSLTWCAGAIAHDSYHSKLYADYRAAHPKTRRVPDAIWIGEKAEKQCLEHQLGVLKDIGAPAREIEWTAEPNNRYWDVKYKNRTW
jgi:hypothetical protein